MSFLTPVFLFGALAAAIPIALHLLKREPEARVKFAPVKLLRLAPVEDMNRRHIREILLLALRVAALVMLALAFARPFFSASASAAAPGMTIVALDTSLSLSAPGQFEHAKQLAKDAINHAAPGDLVGLVTFADTARAVVLPTGDRSLAVSAIDTATTGFGATHYGAALSAASDMIGSRATEHATIVVVTDLQESGWDADDRATVPESARVEIADVGAPPPNLAVTAVRRDADRVVATIRNAGSRARDARVRLTVDGRAASEMTVSLGANLSSEVTLAGARGTVAAVTVDDRDGIQGDNARYLVLDNAGRPSVLVVTTTGELAHEAFYVQQALLAAGADGAAYQVQGVGGAQLSTWDERTLNRQQAIALLSTRGLERHGRDLLVNYMKAGGGVLIAAGPDIDGDVIADLLGGPGVISLIPPPDREGRPEPRTLAPADARHPIFRAFGARAATLGLVKFQRMARIGGSGCSTLARFTTGEPAVVECAPGEGRALVIASDLDNHWNDFPLRATFVPFLHETVRYLAGGRSSVGNYLVGEAPAGVVLKPGIATVPDPAGGAGATRPIAVNVDPDESDPGRLSAGEFEAAVTRMKETTRSEGRVEAREQEDRQHVWQYMLAVMMATLAVESLLAMRTA